MTDRETIERLGASLGEILKEKKKTVATAESCTGGNISACITAIPGSSAYFKGCVVAYANDVKEQVLHVNHATLEKHGAVSEQTVREMVAGTIKLLHADYAVATSGVAGPGGGTKEKPVGTIWIAAGSKKEIITLKQETDKGRSQNMLQATENALILLKELLQREQKDVF